jgi:hypothetical protein
MAIDHAGGAGRATRRRDRRHEPIASALEVAHAQASNEGMKRKRGCEELHSCEL